MKNNRNQKRIAVVATLILAGLAIYLFTKGYGVYCAIAICGALGSAKIASDLEDEFINFQDKNNGWSIHR